MAVGTMIFGAWALMRRRPALPPLALLTLLGSLIPLMQWAGGMIAFRGIALLSFLYMLGFGLAQVVGRMAVEELGLERLLGGCATLFLVGALASAWLALYQWQQLDYLGFYTTIVASGARVLANFNQPNHLATLLVLGLIASACLYDTAKIGAITALALILLLGFALAMTQSRTGLLEVVAVSALLVGKHQSLGPRLTRRRLLLGASIVLALSPAWVIGNLLSGQVMQRDVAEITAGGTRLIHWSAMIDALFRHPWLGYGWNGTVIAEFAVSPDHPTTHEALSYSHNILLDLLLWNGLPLGFIFVAGLVLWFLVTIRNAKNAPALLALAFVVAVFFHALLEYPLYYAYFLLPIGLIIGSISTVTTPNVAIKASLTLIWTLWAMLGIALAAIMSDYLHHEDDLRILRFEQAHIGHSPPGLKPEASFLLTQFDEFLHFARTPERKGMSASQLLAMSEVVKRYSSGANLVRYAAMLALNNRPNEAGEVLRRVCKLESAMGCKDMQALWLALGKLQPEVAGVQWPSE